MLTPRGLAYWIMVIGMVKLSNFAQIALTQGEPASRGSRCFRLLRIGRVSLEDVKFLTRV
jgi:hypothetical protein